MKPSPLHRERLDEIMSEAARAMNDGSFDYPDAVNALDQVAAVTRVMGPSEIAQELGDSNRPIRVPAVQDNARLADIMAAVGRAIHDNTIHYYLAQEALEKVAVVTGVLGPTQIYQQLSTNSTNPEHAARMRAIAAATAVRDAELDRAAGTVVGYVAVALVETLGGRGVMWLPIGRPHERLQTSRDAARRAGLRLTDPSRLIARQVAELTLLGSQTAVLATGDAVSDRAHFYLTISRSATGFALNGLHAAGTAKEAARGFTLHPAPDAAYGVVAAHVDIHSEPAAH